MIIFYYEPMKLRFIWLFFLVCFSCKTSKNISVIDHKKLISFIVRKDADLNKDNQYLFFSKENDFRKLFTLTKSLPGLVDDPDFTAQNIISVILQPTTDLIELKFHKIEIEKDNLNVYYITLPVAGKTFLNRPFIAATIPKFDKLKYVNFYKERIKEKTIIIE